MTTDREPTVKVGIMSAAELNIDLLMPYTETGSETEARGRQTFAITPDGRIEWRGREFDNLSFTASAPGASFEVEGVTIGVNFHWERQEVQRFLGDISIIVEGRKLTLINVIPVEAYLESVISSEMSASASPEFLKAHAVISRSWLLAQIDKTRRIAAKGSEFQSFTVSDKEIVRWYDREDHLHFDVCADDHCQRYQGISRVSTPVAAGAVADTRGMVLTFDGELCDTRFSKCCGGVFEVFETCWDDTPRPYLQPRRDGVDPTDFPDLTVEENAVSWILGKPEAFCNTTDRRVLSQVLNGYDRETPDFYRWTETLPQEKITRLVADRLGEDLGRILSLTPLTRGTSGRIRELKITGTKGERIIGKELMIRRTLSDSHLYSSAFVVEPLAPEADGTPSGFTLHGAGWGHGAGLCQIGAAIMGERGYGYSEILARYYPGSTLTKLY